VIRACALALVAGCSTGHPSPARSGAACPQDRVIELGLQEDVVAIGSCERATGIRIRTGATIDVTPLRSLEVLSGDLEIGPTVGLDTVSLNALVRVGGTIRVTMNGSLRGLYLPRLESVGRIEISNNAVLSTISMPRLTRVESAVVISDNNALELVSAGALTTIGGELVLVGHPRLNLLEIANLKPPQAVRLEGNPSLPPEVAEQLRAGSALP